MEIVIKVSQFLLSLSILILLHEMGHFAFAKLFKTRVEKFYLFFNPWFSLLKFKHKETTYGLGWLPLGGYVKISGMIDESMDKDQMKKPAQPWEFRSKPTWQRLLIMLGGVLVNFILGFFIYIMILFVWGERTLPNNNINDGIWATNSLIEELGIKTGDKIIAFNGEAVDNKSFQDVMSDFIVSKSVDIERKGERITIDLPVNFIERLIDNKSTLLYYPRIPFFISTVSDSSENVGIVKVSDRILSVNSVEVKYFDQFKDIAAQFKGSVVDLKIERDGKVMNIDAKINSEGKLGVVPALFNLDQLDKLGIYNFAYKKYTFTEAVPAGIDKGVNKMVNYLKQLKLIINPNTGAYKGVGGFGTLTKLFPHVWDWQTFWEITAVLSLMLGIMNVLPIPALDGGHVMFLLYEMITRRKPSEKFMEYAQIIGMLILLTLFIYANVNDIFR